MGHDALLVASLVLFVLGSTVAYLVLRPALDVLLGFGGDGVTALLEVTQYLSFITTILIIFGVSFEFPLVIVLLNLAGVLSSDRLRSSRRIAIFLLFLFAGVPTDPGPDHDAGAGSAAVCCSSCRCCSRAGTTSAGLVRTPSPSGPGSGTTRARRRQRRGKHHCRSTHRRRRRSSTIHSGSARGRRTAGRFPHDDATVSSFDRGVRVASGAGCLRKGGADALCARLYRACRLCSPVGRA